MNTALMLEIIRLAASIIQSQTTDNVDQKIDEGVAIASIAAAAHKAYEDNVGKPIDESLLKYQEPIR